MTNRNRNFFFTGRIRWAELMWNRRWQCDAILYVQEPTAPRYTQDARPYGTSMYDLCIWEWSMVCYNRVNCRQFASMFFLPRSGCQKLAGWSGERCRVMFDNYCQYGVSPSVTYLISKNFDLWSESRVAVVCFLTHRVPDLVKLCSHTANS